MYRVDLLGILIRALNVCDTQWDKSNKEKKDGKANAGALQLKAGVH
jgi:hypothetical protein